MPRLRKKGLSGDQIQAQQHIEGYRDVGLGRQIRESLNPKSQDSIDERTKGPDGKAAAACDRSSLNDAHRLVLDQIKTQRQAALAQAQTPLRDRLVNKLDQEAAFVRFQVKLRDVSPGNLEGAFEELSQCASALRASPNSSATLAWLGNEFAENLLSKIHAEDRKGTTGQAEKAASEEFSRMAMGLLNAKKLTLKGFEALTAGFAAGMRGVGGKESDPGANGRKEGTQDRVLFAAVAHGHEARKGVREAIKAATKNGTGTDANLATEQALQHSKAARTLPELIAGLEAANPGESKRDAAPERGNANSEAPASRQENAGDPTPAIKHVAKKSNESAPLASDRAGHPTKAGSPSNPSSVTASQSELSNRVSTLEQQLARTNAELEQAKRELTARPESKVPLDSVKPVTGEVRPNNQAQVDKLKGDVERLSEEIEQLKQQLNARSPGHTQPSLQNEESPIDRKAGVRPTADDTGTSASNQDAQINGVNKKIAALEEQVARLQDREATEHSEGPVKPERPESKTGHVDSTSAARSLDDDSTRQLRQQLAELQSEIARLNATRIAGDTAQEKVDSPENVKELQQLRDRVSRLEDLLVAGTETPSFALPRAETKGHTKASPLEQGVPVDILGSRPGVPDSADGKPTLPRTRSAPAQGAQQGILGTGQASDSTPTASLAAQDDLRSKNLRPEQQAGKPGAEAEAEAEADDAYAFRDTVFEQRDDLNTSQSVPGIDDSKTTDSARESKTTGPRVRTSPTGSAPVSVLGKRQRAEAPDEDDAHDPQDRSRPNPARMREIAAANEQAPAQPAIGQFDPGVAAPANLGPQPGVQPQPVMNEPPQVAPLADANQADPNAVPGDQPLAAGASAGSGITLPRHDTASQVESELNPRELEVAELEQRASNPGAEAEADDAYAFRDTVFEQRDDLNTPQSVHDTDDSKTTDSARESKTTGPRVRTSPTGSAPASVLGKRQRAEILDEDDAQDPQDRSRPNPARMREIAAANEQAPAQPAIGQLDPGVAAPANLGPQPGEQPQADPLNEPPLPAPGTVGNPQTIASDIRSDQPAATGANAAAGPFVPQQRTDTDPKVEPERDQNKLAAQDPGTSGRSGESVANSPVISSNVQADARAQTVALQKQLAKEEVDFEFPAGELQPAGPRSVSPDLRKDGKESQPQLIVTGGKRPSRITDKPIAPSTSAIKAESEPAQQAEAELIGAIGKTIHLIVEGLLPPARELARVVNGKPEVKRAVIDEKIKELIDQQAALITQLESGLQQEIATRKLDPEAAQRVLQELNDKVAAIRPQLFQAVFGMTGGSEEGRLRFVTRLLSLNEGGDTSPLSPTAPATRFLGDMLSDLEKNSELGKPLRHWNPALVKAKEAAALEKGARANVPNLHNLLPRVSELEQAAIQQGKTFAESIRRWDQSFKPEIPLTTQQITRALGTLISIAVEEEALRSDDIISQIPKPDAEADEAIRKRMADRDTALKEQLASREAAAREAWAASIINGLGTIDDSNTFKSASRRNFFEAVREVVAFAKKGGNFHGNASAYAESLLRTIGAQHLDPLSPWGKARFTPRSDDGKATSQVSSIRQFMELQSPLEAADENEDAELGATDDGEEIDDSDEAAHGSVTVIGQQAPEVSTVQGIDIDSEIGDVTFNEDDDAEADKAEAAEARLASTDLMAAIKGQSAPEKAQRIAEHLADKLAPEQLDGNEEGDAMELPVGAEVRTALLEPILAGLDLEVCASLLSLLAPGIKALPDMAESTKEAAWSLAQEALDLVTLRIVASPKGIDAARRSIVGQIVVPSDQKSHRDAGKATVATIDRHLNTRIQAALGRQRQQQTIQLATAKTTPSVDVAQILANVESLERVSAEQLAAISSRAAQTTPRGIQQPKPQEPVTKSTTASRNPASDMPGFVRQVAFISQELAQLLEKLPSELGDWPSHMERVFRDIEVLREDPSYGVSPIQAGRKLGETLGLSRSTSAVEPGQWEGNLQRVLEGAVQFAHSQDDLDGFMRGLLGVAGGEFSTSIAAAAAAVTQQAEKGPVRDRAGWLVEFLMLRSDQAIVSQMRRHAAGNSLIAGAVRLIDTKSSDQAAHISSTPTHRADPRITDAARKDPATLLDAAVDEFVEDPWSERMSLVQAVMTERLTQREHDRLGRLEDRLVIDRDHSAWNDIGVKLAEKLNLRDLILAHQATIWTKNHAPLLERVMSAILGQVSEDDAMVALLKGLADDVTPEAMPALAQVTLKAAEKIHGQSKQRALQVVGTMFQRLYTTLSAHVNRKGASNIQHDAQILIGKIKQIIDSSPATDISGQARLAFSAEYSSRLKDTKG